MKKYFAYVRVSTQKQGQTGVSLQEQRAAIERYAKLHNLTISEWFEERETAAKRGRPIFTQMLAKLGKEGASGVILHKIDRGARNLRDWADLGELVDKGIEVHSANESLDLQSRGGRLSADIQAVVAADYIRNLREETKKGFYGRLKQGLYPLAAPLGYLDRGRGKPKELDPETALLVKKAFELYASRGFSLPTLLREMHRLGLRNKRGGKVSLNGLSRILNNPFYVGIIRLRGSGETFKGIHEPLISKALFDAVQDILRGKTNTRSIRHDYLYRRLLTCRPCGYSLIGETQKGHVYYRCHTSTCPTKGIRQNIIDIAVTRTFKRISLSPAELQELSERIDGYDQKWEQEQAKLTNAAELQLAGLKERKDRLTDAYIDGVLSKDIFDDRHARLLGDIVAVEQNLTALRSGERTAVERMRKFLELLKTAQLSYFHATHPEKRDLLRQITSNRLVSGKNIAVELYPPFDMVAKRANLSKCDLYRSIPRTEEIDFPEALMRVLGGWPSNHANTSY